MAWPHEIPELDIDTTTVYSRVIYNPGIQYTNTPCSICTVYSRINSANSCANMTIANTAKYWGFSNQGRTSGAPIKGKFAKWLSFDVLLPTSSIVSFFKPQVIYVFSHSKCIHTRDLYKTKNILEMNWNGLYLSKDNWLWLEK